MNMQRTLKVMALGIVTALSVGSAIAQTGTLQGRQLFLYDNGTGPNLNRISVQTPADATLVSNWALTLPGTAGLANQLLVNTGGGVLNWTSTLTLQDLTLTGDLGVQGNTTLGNAPTDLVTVNGTMSFPNLTAGQPLQTNALGEVVSELINLTGAADVTGTLPVTNGGTGISSVATGDILYGSAANTLSARSIGAAGDLLTVTGGVPVWESRASVIGSTVWTLGGNTSGITGVNNILGINMASAVPLRLYANGSELMRLTATGDVRIQNLDGVGATQLNIIGTATQAGANLLNVQNNALNYAFRVDEQPGTLARIQIGDPTLDGRIRLFNGVPGGVANIEVQNSLAASRTYTLPTIEAAGRFVVANGSGTADQILLSNGNGNRSVWASAIPTTVTMSFSSITSGTSTGALQIGAGGSLTPSGGGTITANQFVGTGSTTNAVDLATGEVAGILPVANGGTGLSTITLNGVMYGNGTSAIQTTVGTAGQILTAGVAGLPTWSNTLPSATVVPFDRLEDGNNNQAIMVVSGTATLTPSGTGVIEANAITGLAGNGMVTRTASGTFAARTIVGTSPIAVADGDGVLGNPTISITGAIPVANGGTGLTTAPINSILYASAANTYSSLTPGNNQILTSGPTGIPVWSSSLPAATTVPFNQIATGANSTAAMTVDNGASIVLGTAGAIIEANRFIGSGSSSNAVDLATAEVNGILPIANGGTGSSTASGALSNLGGQPLDADLTAISALATTGNLVRTGAGTYATRTIVGTSPIAVADGDGVLGNPTISISGAIPVANGGTGLTTAASGSMLYASAADVYSSLAPGTAGQILTMSGGFPTWSSAVPSGTTISFADVTAGTNLGDALVVGAGSTLAPTGTGTITANIFATSASTSDAVDLATTEVNGILPIANGGTGSSTASGALSNLGGQPLDADLTAISALATTGHLVRTGAGTYATRTIVGTSPIAVADGDGVLGNPTISISGAIPVANGGTGLTTAPINSILYASAANTYSSITPGNNQILTSDGSGVPTWSSALPSGTTISFADVTAGTNLGDALVVGNGSTLAPTGTGTITANAYSGQVPVANGGTGVSSLTQFAVVLGNGAGALNTTAVGATGEVLVGNTGANPTWSSAPSFSSLTLTGGLTVGGTSNLNGNVNLGDNAGDVITVTGTMNLPGGTAGLPLQLDGSGNVVTAAIDLATTDVTGVLPVANGGTGLSTIALNGVMYGNGTSAVQTTVGTAGQILTAGVAGLPTWSSTIPAGTTISFADVTAGTNLGDALVVGAGSTLAPTGTGTITANIFATAASTSNAVDLATTEVNGILPIANGGTGSSSASGALSNLGGQPLDADLTAISSVATTGILVRTGVDTYDTRLIAGTANEITVTNGDGVLGNPTISIPTAVTFTGKTITGGTYDGITTTSTTTVQGPVVLAPASTAVAPATGTGTDIATFTRAFEKVAVTAGGAATTYVNLPTGTDGQVAYVRFACNNGAAAAAVVLRQPDQTTNTTISWAGGASTVILAHMIYSATDSKWVILSAVANP